MGGFFSNIGSFLGGSPEKRDNVSTLRPEQEKLYQQLQNASMGQGAGGAFGGSADYYRGLLSDDSMDFEAFANPQMRQFNEQTIPGLAEQFAGMGSGGLSSSGFRNSSINAGRDLSERLANLRAGLRQQGAQGLNNIGQQGLQPYSQNMTTQQGSPGFLSQVAPLVGTAIGAFGGPSGMAAGNQIGNQVSSWLDGSKKGQSSPYGNQQRLSMGGF